ncbi:stealth conserved region 3 domain-containing protein [Actinomadura xylanilytica]|uniref:stealth conserved region 3 domain-containing protein n=1 Tax=Actinomadura xylanilytica TaxID=887459 RepID=UPI00255AB6C5|nr:stealth conserved region 3 domain-containing protein [Actinomadura xylanilytica]MDL4773223.1 stealth conserved region 3 domain-containing protein [Actinomadura xylanilytica]
MKITYLVTSADAAGEAEQAALEQARRLRAGHDVRILGIVEARAGGAAAVDPGVLVTAAPATLALAVRIAPPATALVHQTGLAPETWTARDEPLLASAPRLDLLITATEHAARWFTASLGAAAPLVEAVPWALPPGPRLRSSLAARTVVLADRLTKDGRAGDAIRAFASIADRFPDWSLRIFGDGPARRSLARLVESLDLQDQVHLLGPAPCLADEIAKCSVRVVTGASAGSGRARAEAFAAGVPVIAYAHPGAGELVSHGVNGHLVQPGVAALAAGLAGLMGDETTRLRLGMDALITARSLTAERDTARRAELFARALAAHEGAADRLAAHTARTVGGFVPAVHARQGERLVQLRNDLGPHDVARLNLETVTEALRDGSVPFLVLRDRGLRHRVAVTEDHRAEALAVLARHYGEEPVYAQPLKAAPGTPPSGPVGDVESWPVPGGLRIFHVIAPTTRTLEFGEDHGCDLEFWAVTADGGRVPLRPTLIGNTVPAEALRPADLTVGERAYPSLEAFTRPLADDVTFPIDAVYTWVDGADPAWLERRRAALGNGPEPAKADGGESRYSSRDELLYSLRSLAMHAPWIRRVWIVTDRQTPPWLDTAHQDVTVVDHRDVFADPDALPTYNSHAIETRLHHIEGLAEHFLYLNDDFFLGRPLTPAHFFHSNGLTKFFPSSTTIPMSPRTGKDATWLAAAKNNRALIEREFGRTPVQALKHAPYALRRSVLNEIERRFPEEVAATARSRIRSTEDISLVSSLYHYYALCTGKAVPGSLSVDTVPLSHSTSMPTLTRLLTLRDRDAFCLNDMASGDLTETQKWRATVGFLGSYFPIPCGFEKSADVSPDVSVESGRT